VRIAHLFAHLAPLQLERALVTDGQVHLVLRHRRRAAVCPACGRRAQRVHSHYTRHVADQPVAGQPVTLHLQVRRFRCTDRRCARRTFAEQVPAVVARYGRRTQQLASALERVGLALGGRPGQRLSQHLGLPASRGTLLRLVHALPEPVVAGAAVLGVDEFAIRRGRVFGTVLVDVDSHRPLDLLDGRSAERFAAWPQDRGAPVVLCRDRGGCYADGGRSGAPGAVQVADRWHLLANLSDAVEAVAAQHRACWRAPLVTPQPVEAPVPQQPGQPAPPGGPSAPQPRETGRRAAKRQERFDQVQALRGQGLGIGAIAARVHLDRKTVRKYAHARSADATSTRRTERHASQTLALYLAHLNRRWTEGCTNVAVLLPEVRAQGYTGSRRTLSRYLTERRRGAPPPEPTVVPPSPRVIAGWVLRRAETLAAEETARLAQVCARCPELATTRDLARQFTAVLRERQGAAGYDAWQAAVTDGGIPRLVSFAAGLRRDEAAVVAGLTLPWSSGVVEGHNTRIKLIKRSMYGR
jgi:transposase